MRSFLLNSCALLLLGCASPMYQDLQPVLGDINQLKEFKPAYTRTVLYAAQIDVIDKHLSGLVLIKTMSDSSTRIVFSNEMGLTFFDFGFDANGGFKVYHIIEQMNKKVVVNTLRKDFELILMQYINKSKPYIRKGDSLVYYIYPKRRGYMSYITNVSENGMLRMEIASKRSLIVQAITKNYVDGSPDTIGISHNNFNFTIGLKKIQK